MEPLRKLLLLASVTAFLPAPVSPQASLSFEKALSAGIYFYNEPPQEQTQKLLRLALKETVCPVTEELPLDQCDFKTDALVKDCQGLVSNKQDVAAIILTCVPVAQSLFFSEYFA